MTHSTYKRFIYKEQFMLKAINAVLISSKDPKRLIDFYSALGAPLKINDHGDGLHAEADFGDVHFAIWGRGASEPVESSNLCFSFHVPELESYYTTLVAKGVKFDHPPMTLPFGGVITNLRDPDGNRITLMRWQSEGKQS